MNYKLITLNQSDDWCRYTAQIPHMFAHCYSYNKALSYSVNNPPKLLVLENNDMLAICPIIEREYQGYKDIATPYGFSGFACIGDLSALPGLLYEFAKDTGYITGYFLQHPLSEISNINWQGDLYKASDLYVLNINLDNESLLQKMHKTKRYDVRKWNKNNSVTTDQEKLAEVFCDLYPIHMRRVEANSNYNFTHETLKELTTNKNTFLLGDAAFQAVALFGYFGKYAEYLFIASEAHSNHDNGLIWNGIQNLRNLGVEYLNLGGGIKANDGVAKFKENFGADKLGNYCIKQIYDKDLYDKLCAVKAVAANKENYFPAYGVSPTEVIEPVKIN